MKTITGIHGVPRSGTSWLAQLFNASPKVNFKFQPLFSYAFKNYLSNNSSSEEIASFFEGIYNSDDDFINMRDKILLKDYPVFQKEEELPHLVFKHVRYHYLLPHLLKQNNQLKLILIIRNPLSVLSSWKNAPREFDDSWVFEEEWKNGDKKNSGKLEEYFGYYKWKEATNLFLKLQKEYPLRVKVVKYSDLLMSTKSIVRSLYDFAEIEFTQQTLDFIIDSRNKEIVDANSVYRIKNRDNLYLETIPSNIINTINADLIGTELEVFLDE
jgi:hypothetical protein